MESKDTGDEPPASPYELYLLLHALKSGAIDFQKFMEEATVWAHKILGGKQHSVATYAKEGSSKERCASDETPEDKVTDSRKGAEVML